MTLNQILGIVALLAGAIVLSIGVNQGSIVTCGKWNGCTTHVEPPSNFVDIALFVILAGIGLLVVGILLLVSKVDTNSKPPFFKTDRGMI